VLYTDAVSNSSEPSRLRPPHHTDTDRSHRALHIARHTCQSPVNHAAVRPSDCSSHRRTCCCSSPWRRVSARPGWARTARSRRPPTWPTSCYSSTSPSTSSSTSSSTPTSGAWHVTWSRVVALVRAAVGRRRRRRPCLVFATGRRQARPALRWRPTCATCLKLTLRSESTTRAKNERTSERISREIFVTFRVSRRPREMHCGHARLCVCLSVCLSAAACLQYYTDPDVARGIGRGCPLVVHYCADLQSVHGLRCYGNIMKMCGRAQR